jgi:hypothetical protein
MPIRSIEKIKIGNYDYGKFANGYIYSAQINQGYSENTNKLTIDIVYQQGANIVLPEKNLTTSYRVEFGDIIFPQMYFISYSKNVAVNEETITCTFVDGSILLDRYYVGLTNRHYKVNESPQSFNVGVYCANCDSSITVNNGNVTRSVANSPNLLVNNLLVVGDEEFIDQACDIPDVKYNFSSLLITMAKISNFTFKNFVDINPLYKTSYTGTLREVLSNWCSDFGFGFYWDFLSNTLICIDLRDPINLGPVSSYINSNFDQNNTSKNLSISSFSEEESLEGTYQQDYIDYILKPARSKQKPIKDFYPILYAPVQISTPYSRIDQVLAKYNSQAFDLYLLQSNSFAIFGFEVRYYGLNDYVLNEVFKNIAEFVGDGNARIIIGYYNKSQSQNRASLASAAADDIGRYYAPTSTIKWNTLNCSENGKYNISTSYEPQPIFGSRPWEKYGGKATLPTTPQGLSTYIIERNPAYISSNTENFSIDNLGPIYVDIEGDVADQLRDTLDDQGDLQPDRYRGMTLIAFKPYLRVDENFNIWNNAEEDFNQPEYQVEDLPDCQTVCEKDSSSEICRKACTTLSALGHGLISKFSTSLTFTNLLTGGTMSIAFPSEQGYMGYVKAEGTFTYVEPGIKTMNSLTNFSADPNVMSYGVNLNDITTNEPSAGQVDIRSIPQNSKELNIVQKNMKKSLSLKIIGMNYGLLSNYLNPNSGLTSFNVYLNDNGIFTDLTFENRPAQKPKPEVIMQKVGPQKTRILK